ncbi:MAG: hypothetical protein GC154_01470 [bacterium]|nr:hypothetical protein [bacterium]
MSSSTTQGHWSHRLSIYFFSTLLSLLFIWLLGFVLKDIDRWEGPDVQAMRDEHIKPEWLSLRDETTAKRDGVLAEIKKEEETQDLLNKSTQSSRETMTQLLEVYRMNLERGITPTEDEHAALSESEKLFLNNQHDYQEANQRIAGLNDRRRELETQLAHVNDLIDQGQKQFNQKYQIVYQRHRFFIACVKLATLIPLLILIAWVSFRYRGGPYIPLVYALLFAVFLRTYLVMFEHFPREFFKYIAILTIISIVLSFLLQRIRLSMRPRLDWLMKQYKEAYTRHRCPVCSFPIQQGALKFAMWTKKGPASLPASMEAGEEERPYVCPSCGTRLYELCGDCGGLRRSLLPYCDRCGAEKPMQPV